MIDKIIAYENGELDHDAILDLFANLVQTGMVWKLQGHYGRTAAHLIETGLISRDGKRLDTATH